MAAQAEGTKTEMARLSRLINVAPYQPGPSINRKAASERANQKDKSDRATVEQVLDQRTRLVLVKMINRGVVGVVEGCVSTGKEVSIVWLRMGLHVELTRCSFQRQMSTMLSLRPLLWFPHPKTPTRCPSQTTSPSRSTRPRFLCSRIETST